MANNKIPTNTITRDLCDLAAPARSKNPRYSKACPPFLSAQPRRTRLSKSGRAALRPPGGA